jgi:hypothetical protein
MRWTNRRRRLTPPDNPIGDRPALGPRILAAPRKAPPNFWMAPPCPLGFPASETRWIPRLMGPRSPNATRLIRRCLDRRSRPPPRQGRCVFPSKTKRMGWDLNPRDAFTSAGFQGRQRGSATTYASTPGNTGETLPGAPEDGANSLRSKRLNRAKSRHNKPNRDH